MRLLYFAPHKIWPVNTGARLRDYHLARQLAGRSSVTFVEMRQAGEEKCMPPNNSGFASVVTLNKDRPYGLAKVLQGLAGPTPVTVLNCWSPRSVSEFASVIRSREFHTVQLEGVLLMKYIPLIQEAPGPPAIVVDWHNIESEIMWRYARITRNRIKKLVAIRTAKLLERSEDQLLDTCTTHTVPSERERQKLLERRPGANIHVIANGIDTRWYSSKEIAKTCDEAGNGKSRPTILFVGSMDYHANIDAVTWFSRTAWPEIARNYPDLQFTIVGRDPVPEVCALASDRIHVTGTVDDIRPFYASAIAAVVPIRYGSGTRLKILEAMAAGVPVVSTRLGAEGIDVDHDVHILLADSSLEIAAAVCRVASSPETQARLSQAAQALVCTIYDWSVIGKQLCGIHEDLVESRPPNALRKIS